MCSSDLWNVGGHAWIPAFQRRLLSWRPDVVFNQYDDVVHGALYEMRVAALVRILGFPITGSPALALALSREKHMSASLLAGAGIPIPPSSALLEKIGDVDRHGWRFPVIVQPGQEHAGIGLGDDLETLHSPFSTAMWLRLRYCSA